VPDLPDQRTALELVLGRRGWGGGGMSRWRDSGGEPEVRGADADNAERNAGRGEADRRPTPTPAAAVAVVAAAERSGVALKEGRSPSLPPSNPPRYSAPTRKRNAHKGDHTLRVYAGLVQAPLTCGRGGRTDSGGSRSRPVGTELRPADRPGGPAPSPGMGRDDRRWWRWAMMWGQARSPVLIIGLRQPHDRREPCLFHIHRPTHTSITDQTKRHYAETLGAVD
jgi:hypothetical protein